MRKDNGVVMVFGVGSLQHSIICRAKAMGLYTVGIDPLPDAACRDDVDAYEVVGGQDFEKTMEVATKYGVSAIVTAATDKPLVMMARVAQEMQLPFYSVDTARWSTDKYSMKSRFNDAGIPCAKGKLMTSLNDVDGLNFPVVVKPRDNSGSRGVMVCRDQNQLAWAFNEALAFTKMDSVLVEEFIEGQEYSIEALHQGGKNWVVQFTEKTTTPYPYNVEMGHFQPATLPEMVKDEIRLIIDKISAALHFENCASHTELKINSRGIFVIETSPRSGGDMISSHLVPLSTGINMEELLLRMAVGETISVPQATEGMVSCIRYLQLPEGVVSDISPLVREVGDWPGVADFCFDLGIGDKVPQIHSSLDRYGHLMLHGKDRNEVETMAARYLKAINGFITITT